MSFHDDAIDALRSSGYEDAEHALSDYLFVKKNPCDIFAVKHKGVVFEFQVQGKYDYFFLAARKKGDTTWVTVAEKYF